MDDAAEGRRNQKLDSTEHQTKNRDENIIGREQKRRDNGGSDQRKSRWMGSVRRP